MKTKLSSLSGGMGRYKISFPRLDGGLNLWDLDYRMANNQSPDMKNLIWQAGGLRSRDGQSLLFGESLGAGLAAYEGLFWGQAFLHIGGRLYRCDPAAGTVALTELADLQALYPGWEPEAGVFFRYGERLYYKAPGVYVAISYLKGGFSCVKVPAFTPVIIINADPTSGSGDLYQPENRYSGSKTLRYTADGSSVYKLPETDIASVDSVKVYGINKTEGADYTVNLSAGTVSFASPPPCVSDNGVEIGYTKADAERLSSIMTCRYAAVYGGDAELCVVLGGCAGSPSAYFWNGNGAAMDPGYFPVEHYNLAGDTAEPITGFGRQQNYLVIFKERSVGRASFGTAEIGGRAFIEMPYVTINPAIGCDLPRTIQLIQNNLVFCNSRRGVHLILDSSSAYENNIIMISRNVNGTEGEEEESRGLLRDLRFRGTAEPVSLDDDRRYWLAVNGHVYLWDYTLSDYLNPSWFYWTDINAAAFVRDGSAVYHMDAQGRLSGFNRSFTDYGGPIHRVFRFATQSFGTYERLKDVLYAIFAVRSDANTEIGVYYRSDYALDTPVAPIRGCRTWRLTPRDLSFRDLGVYGFAAVAKRVFGARRVRHFSMLLENNAAGADLCLIGAELHYRYSRAER